MPRRIPRPHLLLLALPFLAAVLAGQVTPAPLAPPSTPAGATLFTPMAPERTGLSVENRYADPRMWSDRYQELVYGAIGTGVAIGDYDNDGRPDVVVASKVEGCRLFRNRGDWTFEDVTTRAGLISGEPGLLEQGLAWARRWMNRDEAESAGTAWTQGVAWADVNNDGWLDLYVCRFDAPNQLFINQQDGTFAEEAAARGLAVRDGSGMAAFADFDRDGWLDVYLQTNFLNASQSPQGQRDYLFRNNGDGTFTDVTASAGVSGVTAGHSATWWDFDEDGWPDLYVANDFATPDQLYRNNRDGTFTNVIDQVLPHTPYYAMGADLGDVNNDGRIDFFVADMAGTSHMKEQRGMAASRARAQENPETYPAAPQYMRNALYLNAGVGALREAAGLAGLHATDWTWSARLEDLDNDGYVDLHITNGMNREFHNVDLLDRLMRVEDLSEPRRLMKASPVMAEANLAFRNRGDLQFEEVGARWGLDQVGVSFGAAFGDLDGDGDLDLVFTNYEGNVSVLRNDAVEGQRLIVALRGTRSNRFGLGASIRIRTRAGLQVRTLTNARGYLSSSEPILHFGLGDEREIEELTVTWPSGVVQRMSDLRAGVRLTITEPDRAPEAAGPVAPPPGLYREVGDSLGAAITVAVSTSEGTLPQPLLTRRFNRPGPALAVGDVTGDGHEDWVLGGTTVEAARVLRRDGSGVVSQSLGVPGAVPDGPILIFDANGDGRNDILVTRAGASQPVGSSDYQPQLWWQVDGGLAPAPAETLPALPMSVGAASAVDFDRDGHIDVFLGGRLRPGEYPATPDSALLRNTGGRFADVTDSLAPGLRKTGLVTAALWSDVDGDGWVDLLLALEWGGIRYWRNVEGRRFVDQSGSAGFSAAGDGWWTSLTAADFNGDLRLDYVAGNVGLNTPYQASSSAPAVLYSGAFRGSGAARQLIEAHYENGQLYPRRIRRDVGAEIPNVMRRFPRNDLYASSTLPEILGEEVLAAAERWTATEFRSGVFLSQPDGSFRFSPLPRIAQIAPLQGLATGDFNADGHADVYAVQNDHSPVPMVGRFDGGISQLLLGDGRGGFTPIEPSDSGLVVPGDAQALVIVELGSGAGPGFAVTRSQDPLLVFRRTPQEHQRWWHVTLRARAGSTIVPGARILATWSDGRQSVTELHAGSGYLSQSSPTVFLPGTADNALQRLDIRWPDGRESTHRITGDKSNLELSQP